MPLPLKPDPIFCGAGALAAFHGNGASPYRFTFTGPIGVGGWVVIWLFNLTKDQFEPIETPEHFVAEDQRGNNYTALSPSGIPPWQRQGVISCLNNAVQAGDWIDIYWQQKIPGNVEFYAYATVFYGANATLNEQVFVSPVLPLFGPTAAGEGTVTVPSNFASQGSGNADLFCDMADWSGAVSALPPAPWETVLNAEDHGNHMVVSYLLTGNVSPVPAFTTSGAGQGHAQGSGLRPLLPLPKSIHGPPTVESAFTPDALLGKGGQRLDVTVSGIDSADAGSITGAVSLADGSALYNYFPWHTPAYDFSVTKVLPPLITAAEWNQLIQQRSESPDEEGGGVFIDSSPGVMELRVYFRILEHQISRYRLRSGEAEEAFVESWWLTHNESAPLAPLVGDLYEGGVLVGHEVPLSAGSSAVGIEFVLPRFALSVSTGALPLPELALCPYETARWNTLGLEWKVTAKLWYPPPSIPAPPPELAEEEIPIPAGEKPLLSRGRSGRVLV